MASSIKRWNLLDWLAILVVTAIRFVLRHVLQPKYRMFYLDDPRIQFPMAIQETVSGVALMTYFLVIPFSIMVLWGVIFRPRPRKLYLVILGLFTSAALTSFTVATIKNAVGRPRPDLLSRCKASPETPLHTLVTVKACTQTSREILDEGFRSFPSGHAASSFSGLAYLSLFLASQFGLFQTPASIGPSRKGSVVPLPSPRHTPRLGTAAGAAPMIVDSRSSNSSSSSSSTWTPPNLFLILTAWAPFLGAVLIAISRLQDYRHDYADVIVGSTIGIIVAYISWRRVFPALTSWNCAEPYCSDWLDGSMVNGAVVYSNLSEHAVPSSPRADDVELGSLTSQSSPTHSRTHSRID